MPTQSSRSTRNDRSPSSAPSASAEPVTGPSLKREILGIALLLFAVFLAGALGALGLATLKAGVSVQASVGFVGKYLAKPLVIGFGWPAALLVPLVPAVHALRLFGRLESRTDRSWMIFFAGVVGILPVALALIIALPPPGLPSAGAGMWGEFIAGWWMSWFGTFGAWVVTALAASVLMAATLAWNPIRAIVGHRPPRITVVDEAAGAVDADQPKRKRRRSANDGGDGADRSDLALALEPSPDEMPAIDPALAASDQTTLEADQLADEPRRKRKRSKAEAAADHDAEIAAAIDATAQIDLAGDALRTFRVDGELVGRTTGPVVSQFEVEPAPGVKVRQFANLSNDLALAMRASSIRVVAPIPGRGAVGVEVPNPVSEIVSFRELIEARDYQGA